MAQGDVSIFDAQIAQLDKDMQLELARVQAETQLREIRDRAAFAAMSAGTTIQGKTAKMTVIDDIYAEDVEANYRGVVQVIQQSIKHIQRSVENIERIRDVRFRSPWHPKRLVRWFQQRSNRFWYWMITLPVLVPLLAFFSLELWQHVKWYWWAMVNYVVLVLIVLFARWAK